MRPGRCHPGNFFLTLKACIFRAVRPGLIEEGYVPDLESSATAALASPTPSALSARAACPRFAPILTALPRQSGSSAWSNPMYLVSSQGLRASPQQSPVHISAATQFSYGVSIARGLLAAGVLTTEGGTPVFSSSLSEGCSVSLILAIFFRSSPSSSLSSCPSSPSSCPSSPHHALLR